MTSHSDAPDARQAQIRRLREWSDAQLVAALLSYLYRLYDAGGLSSGRSWESSMVEPALALMRRHRPSGDIVNWPSREDVIREAQRRVREAYELEATASVVGEAGTPREEPMNTKSETVKGTYNCPVCGWNEPHSEHAGQLYERIYAMTVAGNDLVRRLRTLKGQHSGTREVDDEIDSVMRKWTDAKSPDARAVVPRGEAGTPLSEQLIEQRRIGHGEGQEQTIADVNAGRIDDLIRPRLERARAAVVQGEEGWRERLRPYLEQRDESYVLIPRSVLTEVLNV